ncbi:MAG: hypothetical protein WCX31_06295 [Salinivirgaceae bacterium]|jgi:hypothetical protein
MNLRLVKLKNFSGKGASVYSLYIEDANKTVFELFVKENISHKSEINDILKRLNTIGQKTGARETFFKHKEGKPSDGVCALFDIPDSILRLYCIRYGKTLIILGGGGLKPKHIRTFQEDEKLTKENYLLREISEQITKRLIDKELHITNDGFDFEGDLNFETND